MKPDLFLKLTQPSRRTWIPYFVLVVSLLLSALATYYVSTAEDNVAGRPRRSFFASRPEFELTSRTSEVPYIALGGLLISFVLFGVTRSQSRARTAAELSVAAARSSTAALQQALDVLKLREQEFKALIEHAPDIISRFDTELRYVYVNPAIEKITGISPQTFIGKTNAELKMPEDFCRLCEQQIRQVFNTKQENEFEFSFLTSRVTEYYHTRLVPEFANDGSVDFVLSIAREITDRKQAESQLLHNAFHDALTGLPNRALFMDRLGHALKRTKRRQDYLFAVLFLDLDRFKIINDSLGHLIGDQLLIAIAGRLKGCMRAEDTVARLGGDEFTILLENIHGVEDATQVASRIQKELSLPFNLSGHEVFTGASIGIALSTFGYERPQDLLRDADTTMYRAKALGKGRSEVFDQTMHAQAIALLQLETDLRRAIERKEFRIHYQPIFSLNSSKITGFEALIRWQHPKRGIVSPAEFISVAEETGLIVPISWWVLSEACHQMRLWQVQFPALAPLAISVNVSSKQFMQSNLIEQISQILQETGLDACSLALEITESAIIQNAESASLMLKQLRSLGVKLFLDDFGTGYSSLSYLHRFPFDTLKIDSSFVSRMGVDGENSEIVQTIVTLAHSMGMTVTAEGVETAAQFAQLCAIKCEHGQGYFFSKPVDSVQAEELIAAQSQGNLSHI